MKLGKYLLLLLLTSALGAHCQWDTAHVAPFRLQRQFIPWMGSALLICGTTFSLRDEMHDLSIQLRDAVQLDGHSKLHFDDYCQFLPVATPFVLNLCGLKGEHNLKQLTLLTGSSYLIGMTILESAKYGFAKQRPDGYGRTSFPSGHTYCAFNGAELIRREYGRQYPWIAVAGYSVATLIGIMRIYNNRHWVSDVAAGAGLGILSASSVYYLDDLLQHRRKTHPLIGD